MIITKVTMTGADDKTSASELLNLSFKYPFVEWGILLSRNSAGGKRFPSLNWIRDLMDMDNANFQVETKFSGHLCGSWVREFLMGNLQCVEDIGECWELFQRIQINTHGEPHDFDLLGLCSALASFPEKEFIFQYDVVNKHILEAVHEKQKNCSALFDLSHGAGVLPTEWPKPFFGIPCGYAGGLSPENILDQLDKLHHIVDGGEIWVDAETHVRSNNDKMFDLTKVQSFLESCKPYTETA